MRYRDLETGVFLARDPIGYWDGPNVYCYVHCNPITHFDAYGLEDEPTDEPVEEDQSMDGDQTTEDTTQQATDATTTPVTPPNTDQTQTGGSKKADDAASTATELNQQGKNSEKSPSNSQADREKKGYQSNDKGLDINLFKDKYNRLSGVNEKEHGDNYKDSPNTMSLGGHGEKDEPGIGGKSVEDLIAEMEKLKYNGTDDIKIGSCHSAENGTAQQVSETYKEAKVTGYEGEAAYNENYNDDKVTISGSEVTFRGGERE
jgi:hypothetical protein